MCGSGCSSSRLLAAALVLYAAALPCAAQRHEHKRAERAEIVALEQQWKQAQISENISEMDHLLSDDFLGITASGEVVTKVQQLDRMRSRQLCINHLDMADTHIKISGNLAVVTSLVKLDGTAQGHPLSGFFRYTRVYQREPGDGWKITNFEATRVPKGQIVGSATAPEVGSEAPPADAPKSPATSPAVFVSPRPQS